jgi:hypothetical protein
MEEGVVMSTSVLERETLTGRANRVLLVGVARSGTSWLIRAMGATPGTLHYYEPDNVESDPTGRRPIGQRGFGPYPVINAGESGGVFGPLWDAAFAGRLPKFESDKGFMVSVSRALLKFPRSIREPLINTGSKVLTALPGKPERVAIKTIYGAFSLDWLAERYDPTVIVIQRNPLNVVSSWRELKIPGFDLVSRPAILERFRDRFEGEPLGPEASELTKIAWQVGLLTTAIGDALDRRPHWQLINHEDLCADPVGGIRGVCESVGMPWSSDVERYLEESNRPGEGLKTHRVTKEQPNRWKQRLTEDEVTEISSVLARFPRRGWIREPSPES